MEQQNRVALVTGASSGIGLSLAKKFASQGYHLALVARSKDKLEEIKQSLEKEFSIRVHLYIRDLAQPTSPQTLFEATEADGLQVEILVNNAGFGLHGHFLDNDWSTEQEMLQLNIIALTELSKLYARPMVARGSGKILNVASTAAFQPGPLMAVYYASKSYVLSFSEALRNELRETGVSVTVLCPGPTWSKFQQKAKMEGSRLLKSGSVVMTADEVSEVGYEGLMKNKSLVIPGTLNRLTAFSVRFLPRNLVTTLSRFAAERA